MGIKEIRRDNLRNRDNKSYCYKLNVGNIEQSLFVTNLTNPIFINFNYFEYYNGNNLRLHYTKNLKNFEIINNNDKIITIYNNEIVDVQNRYKTDLEMEWDNLKPDLGEELILTDDGKKIRSKRKKSFTSNKLIDIYYEYDDKNRLISTIEDKFNSEYKNCDIYEYDDNDRIIRMIHKKLSNIMSDTTIEYIEIPDQDVINEFTRFFNLMGINRISLINELNAMDISLYDNVEINDLRRNVK